MTTTKQKVTRATMLALVAIFSPIMSMAQGATGNPLQSFFDAISNSLDVVSQNKATIMSIVGAVGLILAIVAWGTDTGDNNPKLVKVIKGAFLIVIVIEVFLFFIV